MLDKSHSIRLLVGSLAVSLSLCASGALADTDPVPIAGLPVDTSGPSDSPPTRVIAELQQRIRDKSVHELRASTNGDYATTLMLADDQVVCYVGLLYQNRLWRVSRYSSLASAEAAYRKASTQSAALADQVIQRQLLATQQRQYERAIQNAEAKADALSNELRAEQAQRERMTEDQKTIRAAIDSTEADNRNAQSQLAKLRQEIRRMEASLADSGHGLPASQRTRR